ncbi:hypothetical protein OH76DRAFT_1198414 [Lentinus brumalis]|uniref:Uncharacterized protein n=1 Tax=Lentinus brumalis TaxID=2498619 RepID=A0A371CTE7_9APHY|nr:hypothetical protein OH76DRAFT_1198414 [Polyporus brumalis]
MSLKRCAACEAATRIAVPRALSRRHLSSRKGDQPSPKMGLGKIPPALKNSDFMTAEQALRGMHTADS